MLGRRWTFGVALVLSATYQVAQATTLAELFEGQSLLSQDKEFYEWGVLGADRFLRSSGNDQPLDLGVDYSEINVALNIDDVLNPTLNFTANDNAGLYVNPPDGGATEILQIVFSYKVRTVDGSAKIVGSSLALTEFSSSPIYRVGITETLGGSQGGLPGSEVFAYNYDEGIGGTFQVFDSSQFQPQSFLFVTTTLKLVAANNGPANGSARLTSFQQGFGQVPEPATLALLGLGLAGIAITKTLSARSFKFSGSELG